MPVAGANLPVRTKNRKISDFFSTPSSTSARTQLTALVCQLIYQPVCALAVVVDSRPLRDPTSKVKRYKRDLKFLRAVLAYCWVWYVPTLMTDVWT